jgi:type IV secretion system protein VirB2
MFHGWKVLGRKHRARTQRLLRSLPPRGKSGSLIDQQAPRAPTEHAVNRVQSKKPARVSYRAKALLLIPALAMSSSVLAQSGANPAGSGPIVAALLWLQGTLLGNVATAVAVMAVAAVGFMMLTGRLNWRFGATVIIGCFILFGASAIVAGIQSAAG